MKLLNTEAEAEGWLEKENELSLKGTVELLANLEAGTEEAGGHLNDIISVYRKKKPFNLEFYGL